MAARSGGAAARRALKENAGVDLMNVRSHLGNYGLRVEFRWCLSFSFYHRVHSFDGEMNLHKLL
jgi:hypothetical protein